MLGLWLEAGSLRVAKDLPAPEPAQARGEAGAAKGPDLSQVTARRNLNADYGIGITGVAGNDEVEGKPPGTMHIAVAGELGADHISYAFYQGRQATKRRAVTTALFLLRRILLARER